ncbi:hypothetical protein DT065_16535 [Salicibibacter kimchii]|uniref:Uncharacterized protein n=1 Tax=Salicibibacter kimchii TaxID=2099786 RepID=A0A345C4A4_9BACI|nr:hypothetical protein DT065_16535 [Salicibibacter kimchii]
MSEDQNTSILGVDVQAKRKTVRDCLDEYFVNPLIHKQIHGNEVYVPLDLRRLWPRQYIRTR